MSPDRPPAVRRVLAELRAAIALVMAPPAPATPPPDPAVPADLIPDQDAAGELRYSAPGGGRRVRRRPRGSAR